MNVIEVTQLRLNYGFWGDEIRFSYTDKSANTFSWSAQSDFDGDYQTEYFAYISYKGEIKRSSGWVKSRLQECKFNLEDIKPDLPYVFGVKIKNRYGEESEVFEKTFYFVCPKENVQWIGVPKSLRETGGGCVYRFVKDFTVKEKPSGAFLYVCGLGYHEALLNGEQVSDSYIEPLFSDYSKTCYISVLPVKPELFKNDGPNEACVRLANGWRNNDASFKFRHPECDGTLSFIGETQLYFALHILYEDGSDEWKTSDTEWKCSFDKVTDNSIYNGETYDAARDISYCENAVSVKAPDGVIKAMTVEPVKSIGEIKPVSVYRLKKSVYIVDFGINIAGVCRVKLPKGYEKGHTVRFAYAELLDEDGDLYTEPLRTAKCTDEYVYAGNSDDLEFYQPTFTYHGFRYVRIEGFEYFDADSIVAVRFMSLVDNIGFFRCGNALINTVHSMAVDTERANIQGIFTDCPQRDERLGWMNDATVRFEETPYNFDVSRLFSKTVADVIDQQYTGDGSITCTAPFVYGKRPADPCCSGFIVAGIEDWIFNGNDDIIKDGFDGFCRWEDFLTDHSNGYIVNYSHYGDWASPRYACIGGDTDVDAVRSACTPGEFISTSYYYYNAAVLSFMAKRLGREKEYEKYSALAQNIKNAMLEKWWDGETGIMCTGSQACQSMALWLGILPIERRKAAAQVIHRDLVSNNYKITTGNLCTRYMFEMLAEYGFVDDAFKIMTATDYPSFGFMFGNEATTVWERFELKKSPTMNSHSHPMYASADRFMYAYLAGIKPVDRAFERVKIEPFFPSDLPFVQAVLKTCKGELSVRWIKRYSSLYLYVSVPFGVEAQIIFDGESRTVGSGYYIFTKKLNEENTYENS